MEKTIIFHLSANKKLANEVAKILNAPVGEVEIEHFLDGEIMARNMTNVRGKNAIIIQSTGKPAQDNIMEIASFISQIYPDVKYEILNYNPLAEAKYHLVEREFCFKEKNLFILKYFFISYHFSYIFKDLEYILMIFVHDKEISSNEWYLLTINQQMFRYKITLR